MITTLTGLQALVHSNLAPIKTTTYGINFFGNPHQGGNGLPLIKILLNVLSLTAHSIDRALKHEGKNSELLQMQSSQFNAISKDFDMKLCFEMYPTPLPIGATVVRVPIDSFSCIHMLTGL